MSDERVAKGSWEDWEPQAVRELYSTARNINILAEAAPTQETLLVMNKELVERFAQTIAGWPQQPCENAKRAMLILAMCVGEQCLWSKNNDILVTRLLGLVYTDDYIAHPDGVVKYDHGHFGRIEEIPAGDLVRMEKAMALARSFFLDLMKNNIPQEWARVFAHMKSSHHLASLQKPRCSADFKLPEEGPAAVWALDMAKALAQMSSQYLAKGKGKDLVDSIGTYLQEPKGSQSGIVDFIDASISLRDPRFPCESPRVYQVPKSRTNRAYLRIPVSLAYQPPEADVVRLRKFLATYYAGNEECQEMDMSMEALSTEGKATPPCFLVTTGDGEDGKSLRTLLRSNYFGNAHVIISPKCFQVDDELRKQGKHFAHARAATVPECNPGDPLIEDEMKSFAGNGQVACRPLFGKLTEYFCWIYCGKWWELNKAFPSIRVSSKDRRALRSFIRRFRVRTVSSSYTNDESKLDAEGKVFLDDPDLPEFLVGESARYIYAKMLLLPFLMRTTARACFDKIKNPSEAVMEATLQFVLQMANGGMQPDAGGAQSAASDVTAELQDAEKMQRLAHALLAGEAVGTCQKISRMRDIPGAWVGGHKPAKKRKTSASVTKVDNFKRTRAMWPFLFATPTGGRTGFLRLQIDLALYETTMSNCGEASFGSYSFSDWGSVFEMKRELANIPDMGVDALLVEDAQKAADEQHAGTYKEIINITAVGEENDREPNDTVVGMLAQRRGAPRRGDWLTWSMRYVRKHGIPGRRWAKGFSIQMAPERFREKGFHCEDGSSQGDGFVFLVADLNNSLPAIMYNELMEYIQADVDDDFDVLKLFIENYQVWRVFLSEYCHVSVKEAKLMLITLFFSAVPKVDLPFLWALALDIKRAGNIILANPKFAYLDPLFGDRRSPSATRLHYALAAAEDSIVTEAESCVKAAATSAEIVALLFDGFVVRVLPEHVDSVKAAIKSVGDKSNVIFKVRQY